MSLSSLLKERVSGHASNGLNLNRKPCKKAAHQNYLAACGTIDEFKPPIQNPPRKRTPRKIPIPRQGSLRHLTFTMQDGICFYCKRETPAHEWTLDHKYPRSFGGGDNLNNLAGCCDECNTNKGHLTVEEFLDTKYIKNKLKENYETSNAITDIKKSKSCTAKKIESLDAKTPRIYANSQLENRVIP